MPKSADERLETMERKIALYRIFVVVLIVSILVMQRQRVVGWIDTMESWMGKAANTRAVLPTGEGMTTRV
jgi:hypothetical protein